MRLFGKWRILVEGDGDSLKALPLRTQGRDYLLNRLFAGEPIEEKGLEHYGIRVRELTENEEVITVPPDIGDCSTKAAGKESEERFEVQVDYEASQPRWHHAPNDRRS